MDALSTPRSAPASKTRRTVGAVAVALLLTFTVLAFIRVFNLLEWLLADAALALVANLILRRVGRQAKQ
ncbi:MAG TPA: hypothetical protein VK536_05120 [Candidatus Limnocylindrales bacterium]|nr:hypothetical protein [Candidatus Limnocylindrales bacterium]